MSVPSTSMDTGCGKDPKIQEAEHSTSQKCDISSLPNTSAKGEIVQAVNGALPEASQQKNGSSLEHQPTMSALNGQDEKPRAETPHREIPGLLPLQPMTVVSTSSTVVAQSVSPRQPPPPLLPMKAVTTSTTNAPVLATKSAPPPLPSATPSPGKAKGKLNVTSNIVLPKEAILPSPRTKQQPILETNASEQEQPKQEEKSKKRKSGLKKRHSFGSSVHTHLDSAEKGDTESGDGDGDVGRKSKRARTRTQPFQSSDMDPSLLRAIKATAAAAQHKSQEEKLVVFFKGEFLAVRNAEGGFYICQATHNITRGSHKIRIRWLSQVEPKISKAKGKGLNSRDADEDKEETGYDVYSPDFYDNTDFECILTNLDLEKLGRDRFGLPLEERQRTENILRRAIDLEQGVYENVEVTEEHPDGLDVSLFHDESQLTRKRRKDRKGKEDRLSTSESDSKDEAGSASGSSGTGTEIEPEPTTSYIGTPSTSAGASTSTGRGTKRTRAAALAAAAARKKSQYAQIMIGDDDDDYDDEEERSSDEDIGAVDPDEEDTSSDSDSDRHRRRRTSPRSRHTYQSRVKTRKCSTRRGKRSPPLKVAATPIKKRSNKAVKKETAVPSKSKTNANPKAKETKSKNIPESELSEISTVGNDKETPQSFDGKNSPKEDTKEVVSATVHIEEKNSQDSAVVSKEAKDKSDVLKLTETKADSIEMESKSNAITEKHVLKSTGIVDKVETMEVAENQHKDEKEEQKSPITEADGH